MLTYEDCLGMCGLTREEVAAIARHEHLPEILALELGARLYASAAGRASIERMIEADIADAHGRRDARAAAELEQVRHAFARGTTSAAVGGTGTRGYPDSLERRLLALGFDVATAARVRQRIEAQLPGMLRAFGLAHDTLRGHDTLALLSIEARCAVCAATERCRRFLADGDAAPDAPDVFCPNATLFHDLAAVDATADRTATTDRQT